MWSPLDERFQPPDEPRVSAYCAWCDGEIYVGDVCTSFTGGYRTHEGRCEDEYIRAELGIERTIAD
ncbi:hypothetical protein NST07_25800 [Paenibacillus sp. FSL L8-0340]|uniref:hypothetical protein n=1 Tax=Paenibacillus sp. FSL L8-0340 TaxID=2954685 RepID=UPI0031592E28